MIIEAIDSRFNPDKDTYQPTFTASNYLKENNKVPYIPSSDNFIKFFKLNGESVIINYDP